MRRERLLIAMGSLGCAVAACGNGFSGGSHNNGGSAGANAGSGPLTEAGSSGSGGFGNVGGNLSSDGGANAAGDSSSSSGGDPSGGAPVTGGAGSAGAPTDPEPEPCESLADCPSAQNCVNQTCVPALVSCAAQKNSYPGSKDGVYWIATPGVAQRAYCDMSLAAELCTEVQGEHQGRTRDKAAMGYRMTSVLALNDGVCKMWAIRGADDGHPLNMLSPVAGVAEGQTCIALGFAADGTLGNCAYGSARTNCGFASTPLHRYGNTCSGCTLNDGDFDRWTLQGPVISGPVLSSWSGTAFTTCKTSK